MKKLLALVFVAVLMIATTVPAVADTTDLTVTATPTHLSIDVAPTPYDFLTVAASATPSTAEDHFTVTNGSTVAIDVTIYVTGDWTGGVGWTHSDTATAGADTAGLTANQDGTWGTGDVIVKKTEGAGHNEIVTAQAASTDFDFGLKLYAPTSFSDGVEKSVVVRLSATATP